MNAANTTKLNIAAWNVNSARARMPHILRFLSECEPDIVLLQETKCTDENFPAADLEEAGYVSAHHGQKSYNGVAIVSRLPLADVVCGMPNRADDPQARVVAATVQYKRKPLRLVSVYAPNGQSLESDKYQYKLEWFADFCDYLSDLQNEHGAVLAGGDYNIAPADEDVFDIEEWGLDIAVSPPERAALQKIFNAGFHDAHRLFDQPAGSFTWWDYRAASYRRNRGLRIDLMLLSAALKQHCTVCTPKTDPREWERPSDHAPVIASFA